MPCTAAASHIEIFNELFAAGNAMEIIMSEKKKKRIDKKIVVSGIKVLSFILIFVVLLEVFSLTIFSKSKATKYKNNHKNAYSYTNEVKDTIQLIALGNSDLYSALIPVKLWSEQGYTSTVISSPRQTVMETYSLLGDALKSQQPDIVLIETDMLYNGINIDIQNSQEDKKDSRKLPILPYLTNEQLTEDIQDHFSVFMLHDSWKQMIAAHNNKKEDNTLCEHGYYFSKKIRKTYKNNYMDATTKVEEIPSENIYYLNKIKERCDNIGAKLLLVELPSIVSWSYPRHNALVQYADEHGVEFIDFNLLYKDIKLDFKRDFRDNGNHLNYYGARKVTVYLGNFINQNYQLIDNREDESFKYWDDFVNEFIDKYSISVF